MKTTRIKRVSFIGILILLAVSLSANSQELKDFDGNVYKTIKYGVQTWSASNLNVSHFRNGDIIPEAKTETEWAYAGNTGKPAWCYYDNDTANGKKLGKLYNWFAISDKRGLVPEGWHVPGNADWGILVQNLMGVDIAGTRLKSTTGWKSNTGTDNIGFSAIPGGYRDPDGKFKDIETTGRWWSNSSPVDVKPSNKIYSINLSNNSPEISYIQSEKGAGYAVRWLKD